MRIIYNILNLYYSSYNSNFFQSGNFATARSVSDLQHLKDKPSIYLATSSPIADIELFFDPPNYDQAAFDLARKSVQPVTLGVFFSIGSIVGPAINFTGPVFVVDGTRDFPFCGRQCDVASGLSENKAEAVKVLYPASTNFSASLVPYTGHGITAHHNSAQASEQIISFLKANQL